MKHALLMAAALLAVILLGTGAASAQTACETYQVRKGDSLHTIAERVPGLSDYWQLYRENRRTVGRNPNILRIGSVLRIPCVGAAEGTGDAATTPDEDTPVSFLTANGYAPYTDESLENRGLFTRLVEQAMLRAAPEQAYEVVFVNDRAAHLEVLLPRGVFDAGFPWPSPGCDATATACGDYLFTDPFYEIVDGFFSRAGDGYENVVDPVGFEGATICRPEGHTAAGIAEWAKGLPAVAVVQSPTAEGCFARLMRGDADIVALETRMGGHVVSELGLGGQVVENRHLFQLHPLRVAVHQSNPRGPEIVETLNRGLKLLLESGEWDSIVSNGLDSPKPKLTN